MGITSHCEGFIALLKQITVEPYSFFFMFGYAVRLVTFQDLLVYRGCRYVLNYSEEICLNLEHHETEQTAAQKIGNNLYVGHVMVSTLPALIVATFVGPWSDKYGRRIPLICASFGTLLDSAITTIITSTVAIPPALYLASALLAGISGGFIISLSCSYSYLSDITDERSRQSRFAILEFFFILATPLGTVIGGQIFNAGSHISVLAAAPISFGCAFLWAVTMLKETRPRQSGVTRKQMLRDLLRYDNVKDTIKTCTMKRPGNVRLQIWLLIFASCTIRLVNMGTLAIGYYFSKKMYMWGVSTYSNAITIFHVCNALTTLTLVPFMSRTLMIHEAVVGLIGILSLMAKVTILSVAEVESLFFFGWFAGLLSACGGISVRSRLSKLVSKKEQGRVFSLLATCEALTPVLGTISFTQIYNASLDIYPGIPYFVGTLLLVPSALVFGWMSKMPTTSFAEFEGEEPAEETPGMKELKEVASGSMEKT